MNKKKFKCKLTKDGKPICNIREEIDIAKIEGYNKCLAEVEKIIKSFGNFDFIDRRKVLIKLGELKEMENGKTK